ncbi:MAG: 50S ribosomal protein L24 [Nitrososphaerales archaeon]
MKASPSSSKPTKVRKNFYLSPQHEKGSALLRASIATDLKSKYGRNSIRVRPGDSVKLVRGEYSGIEGKVQKVFPNEGRVTVEGVTREKIAGGTTQIRIHASNLVVTSLNLDDKFRRQKLEGSK